MALTVTKQKVYVTGDRKEVVADITGDNSYPTGGWPLTALTLGLEVELNAVAAGFLRKADNSDAVHVAYDQTNNKLLAYQSTTGAPSKLIQVANATDLSAYSGRVRATGKGSASA